MVSSGLDIISPFCCVFLRFVLTVTKVNSIFVTAKRNAIIFLRHVKRKRRKLYCFHLLPHYLMSLFSFPCVHLSVLLKDYLYRALFVVQI